VMLISFVSASSSLRPLPTCFGHYPCGLHPSDRCSGSGLTANRINQFNAFGTLSCLWLGFLFSSTSASQSTLARPPSVILQLLLARAVGCPTFLRFASAFCLRW